MTVGVLVGRFQPFHSGHLEAVRYSLKKVDYLYIVIGSSQKSHERDNPFTAGERVAMIKAALDANGVDPQKWMAIPIADTLSHALWPAILKATVPPFQIVFTNDGLTTRLLKEQGIKVEAVPYFERSNYSATNVRNRILEEKDWEKLVPKPVASMVKEVGGVERVRSMIHKDLERED
ncbi:MAG TPA: nicotinamide-nucleotide adenylyltransferase [Nitrososphaerales archaeon]|nr:nicotinamide-nucleotide adenylyltransferase [Nitrososphaerales archaeon]